MKLLYELILNIDLLVGYISPGFLLVNAFMWVNQKKWSAPTIQIVSSVVAAYFVWKIFYLIDPFNHSLCYTIFISAIGCILGLLTGRLYRSGVFNSIIGTLGLGRTTNESIFEDARNGSPYIFFYDNESKKYYCGWYQYSNEINSATYITICRYCVWNKDLILEENHRKSNDFKLVFNSSDCRGISFIPNHILDTPEYLNKIKKSKSEGNKSKKVSKKSGK